MSKIRKVLILEDDLEALEHLLRILKELSFHEHFQFHVTVLSDSESTDTFINKTNTIFDIILLDRDCARGKSFHILDLEKQNIDGVIAISSVPAYNEQVKSQGVKYIVWKDYDNIPDFADKVKLTLKNML